MQAKNKLIVFVILLAFSIALDASAETRVGGPIAIDITWTLDKSPYIVTQDVVVSIMKTLTIEPGVQIKFDNCALIIDGGIVARGTQNSGDCKLKVQRKLSRKSTAP